MTDVAVDEGAAAAAPAKADTPAAVEEPSTQQETAGTEGGADVPSITFKVSSALFWHA